MKRGEIWTIAGGPDYAGKARLVVIVQDDRFDATDSISLCPFTSDPTEMPLFRPVVHPNEINSLKAISRVMADKITTLPKTKLGYRIGRLSSDDMARLNRAMVLFLGIASPPT